MLRLRLRMTSAAILCLWFATAGQAADGLIELTVAGKPVRGKQFAQDSKHCWLADREGRLTEVPLDKVTAFRQIHPQFTSKSPGEVRDEYRKGLGKDFEVQVRGDYVVCAPPGHARAYAELLNQTQHDFNNYLRVRRFDLQSPQFPMVAWVLPSREEFFNQCRIDGVPVADSLRGYYHPQSNRIIFFEESTPADTQVAVDVPRSKWSRGKASTTRSAKSAPGAPPPERHSAADDLHGLSRDTTVHEAIHQLAFNSGLHARVGTNPLWVVEGFAMQFEIGALPGLGAKPSDEGVNLARLQNFADYRAARREAGALISLIAGESSFGRAPLDAYSEAWMLTYFLIQTRPAKYSHYLKQVAKRAVTGSYSSEDRLADFKEAFGNDLSWFEVEYLRYANRLAEGHLAVDAPDQGR